MNLVTLCCIIKHVASYHIK